MGESEKNKWHGLHFDVPPYGTDAIAGISWANVAANASWGMLMAAGRRSIAWDCRRCVLDSTHKFRNFGLWSRLGAEGAIPMWVREISLDSICFHKGVVVSGFASKFQFSGLCQATRNKRTPGRWGNGRSENTRQHSGWDPSTPTFTKMFRHSPWMVPIVSWVYHTIFLEAIMLLASIKRLGSNLYDEL